MLWSCAKLMYSPNVKILQKSNKKDDSGFFFIIYIILKLALDLVVLVFFFFFPFFFKLALPIPVPVEEKKPTGSIFADMERTCTWNHKKGQWIFGDDGLFVFVVCVYVCVNVCKGYFFCSGYFPCSLVEMCIRVCVCVGVWCV